MVSAINLVSSRTQITNDLKMSVEIVGQNGQDVYHTNT